VKAALITGATGLLGSRLVHALLARGVAARVVGRDRAKLAAALPGAEPIAWDGVHLPDGALAGIDTIFHLAGEPVAEGRWTAARKARIRESRVDSTRSIVEAIAAHVRDGGSAPDLVCASAVGLYGSRGDEVLTEESAPGRDFLAEVCAAWEAEARAAEAHGGRVARVRIGIVLARDGGALARMLPIFRGGVGGRLGDGRQWMPWIHLDDVVGILLHAAQEPSVSGAINAVSPAPATNADFTRALGRALHRPAVIPAPTFALRAAFGEMAEVVLGSQRVLPKVAERTGYAFRWPTLEGALRAAIDGAPQASTAKADALGST
jgi:hypothetical protein